ncbi:hypothetical protein ERO13_A01G088000v2 [Gossypium hirsutum]|uniref:Uncharacterized protein n=2 Tax=Gossypium TaxID=3633 RepID=A0A5D3AAS3_GOSMU|nr:hypothetical protein ES319_A01G089200v1 [Gossypium barbadense]KAG4213918.1 hypothetical protein ERO13_A01G088000v2 [Gossypium hirsutum]TYJ48837.1 hypothetical protein E1A91_A01G091900v1 [Gossypium mustelinum]TYJ48838.1 hypothetical protein E1A91_A01G091900v1 [Gossypium mustelinum]
MAWLKHLAMLFIGSLCIHGYLLPFLLKLIGDQTSMNGGVEKERGCNSTRRPRFRLTIFFIAGTSLNQDQDQSTSLR